MNLFSKFLCKSALCLRSTLLTMPLLVALFRAQTGMGLEDKQQPVWGVNAVVLKPQWSGSPALEDLLVDRQHTVSLNRFCRDGGQHIPATPTECRISYNGEALLVVFRCTEENMSFPAVPRNAEDWYALINGRRYADTLFPDQVDFLVQPDMASASYYQFAATPDGKKLGCSRLAGTNYAPGTEVLAQKVEAFEASVSRRAKEWVVFLRIPWSTFGGKPNAYFGVMPIRTRWRDGEVSSPVAIDFMDEVNSTMKTGLRDAPAVDLFIETHFAGPAKESIQGDLCRLPSGVLRWQRPTALIYPNIETRRQIWQMQSSLATPTDLKNLAERLRLTRGWTDLMALEGFTGLPRAWSATLDNLMPYLVRRQINNALRENAPARAGQILDNFLAKLDKVSRWWYADGSPGDILTPEWVPVGSAESIQVQNDTLLMRCRAGDHIADLSLALPTTGGVRIFSQAQGYFKPSELQPLKTSRTKDTCSFQTSSGKVVVRLNPFSVSFYGTDGKEVTQIGSDNLSFRFGPDGSVLAFDFKNRLDANEVIYGFGERYDCFNENGNVVTLWGTDDWIGNGVGLRNTTYKPLPIFHSSKGYMVFDNSTYRLRADIGRTDPKQYRITQHGPIFDFYFYIGAPKESLRAYTALTGRVPLPPKWVFEPWMGRGESAWANGPLHNPVWEETNTITRFAELDIPHSAIYAEGRTANMPELHEFAAPRGIRILGYFAPDIRSQRLQSLMPELRPEELPILRCGGSNVCPGISYVDFSHPLGKELVRRALKPALDLGVAGSMVDFGDMVPDEAVFYGGKRGAEMHNFYSYAYHRTVSELYREKRGDDFILYGRAAGAGGQHWVGQFAGDHSGNFAGLRAVLTGALNLCACGYSTWGSDVCGYFGMPEPAVYMRWFQFACFSPIWRPHGKTTRDPWSYGAAAVTNYKFLAWTRENILNYTYNAAVIAHETGVPIMRSMPVSFPDEPPLAGVRDQYMFGNDLLVAPVLSDETSRTIVFPAGAWTSFWDGRTVRGPAQFKVSAPLDTIPVYLRSGAVVPVDLSPELKFGQSMSAARVRALVLTIPKGNESTSLLGAEGRSGEVTVRPELGRCLWQLTNLSETDYLLLYGVSTAHNIKVDGKSLPRLNASGVTSTPDAWETDPSGNRLLIHLPSGKAEQKSPTRTIEVEL